MSQGRFSHLEDTTEKRSARPTLLQELMTPLQDSAAHLLGTANGSSSSDMSSGRQAHKVRLLNSLWTWNAFVKEWRSVRVPVGAQLMKDVSASDFEMVSRAKPSSRSLLATCDRQCWATWKP